MNETDSELEPVISGGRQSWKFTCCRLCTSPANLKWLSLLFMLFGQLIGLILFSIWAFDCFFREFKTTALCKHFDLFPMPKMLECLWLFTTSTVATVLIYQVLYLSPGFCGTRTVIRHLLKKKYFYEISFLLLVVLSYDVYVISNSRNTWKTLSYVSFNVEKSLTGALMFLVNFLPRFWNSGDLSLKFWMYKAALAMFALQNFSIALLGSTIAAYKVLNVPGSETAGERELPGPKSVISLMLLVTNNGFRYFVGQFFLSKIFDEELNILGGNTIEESIGNQDREGYENDEDGERAHRMIPAPITPTSINA